MFSTHWIFFNPVCIVLQKFIWFLLFIYFKDLVAFEHTHLFLLISLQHFLSCRYKVAFKTQSTAKVFPFEIKAQKHCIIVILTKIPHGLQEWTWVGWFSVSFVLKPEQSNGVVFAGSYRRSGDWEQTQEWGMLSWTSSAMGGGGQTLTAEMGRNHQEALRRFSSSWWDQGLITMDRCLLILEDFM